MTHDAQSENSSDELVVEPISESTQTPLAELASGRFVIMSDGSVIFEPEFVESRRYA